MTDDRVRVISRSLDSRQRLAALPVGAAAVGVVAGAASAVFLWSLDVVTDLFAQHPRLVWGLPVLGALVGAVLALIGDRAGSGMATVMRELRTPSPGGVPALLAPVVLLATLATHLVGGSAGREGTALQMSVGLTDPLMRHLGLADRDRRQLLMVAVAAGFGSVFGVPWAGALFGIEVAPVGRRVRARAAALCLIGSWTAHATAVFLGATHAVRSPIDAAGWEELGWTVLAGAAFGVTAFAFVRLTDAARAAFVRWVPWFALRLGLGGLIVLGATLVLDTRDYNGLSLPLLETALSGGSVAGAAFAWKAGFTTVTVGSGFRGGEVTPLFVIGATLGASLAAWWGVAPMTLAAVGMVATFGAAANAPIASTVMGVEMFGWRAVPVLAVGCVVARWCSGPHHLYVDGDSPDSGWLRRGRQGFPVGSPG